MSVGGGGSFPIAFLLQVQGDQEVKSKIQSLGGAFQSFGSTAEKVNTQTEKLQPNFSQAALGISAAAASASSLYFQFDNLEKASLRVETAEKNLTNARAGFISAQTTINDLVAKGKEDTPQYAEAVLRAAAAQDQLGIAEQKVGLAQGDLAQSQTQFALTVIPTTIGAVSSLSLAVKGMNLGLASSRVGSVMASLGLIQLKTTATGVQLAIGPLGWALLAIGTVFTLVATNAFGIRDALDSFAKKVEEIFPILKPVFDFFRTVANTLFPDAETGTKDLSNTVDSEFKNIATTVDNSTGQQKASLQMLSGQFADTNQVASTEIANLASNVNTQANSIVDSANRARAAMASIGASSGGMGGGSSNITLNTPPSGTLTNPNPLGGTFTYTPQMFGSTNIADIRAQGGIKPHVSVDIHLDGKEIAQRLSRYKVGDRFLGQT